MRKWPLRLWVVMPGLGVLSAVVKSQSYPEKTPNAGSR